LIKRPRIFLNCSDRANDTVVYELMRIFLR
jgi:hypothetical protein